MITDATELVLQIFAALNVNSAHVQSQKFTFKV